MLPDSLIRKAKRDDLDPLGRAKIFRRLIDEFGWATKKVAEEIGKSSSYVSNTLRLLRLPAALKDGLVSGLISSGHGRALAAIGDKKKMIAAYKEILKEEGSVREAEALARKMKKKREKGEKKGKTRFEKMKKKISQSLDGAKVKFSRSRVQTRIWLTMKGNEEKTDPWLEKIYQRLTKPNSSKGQ